MKRVLRILAVISLIGFMLVTTAAPALAGEPQDVETDAMRMASVIDGSRMRLDVEFISADSFQGRRTGTPGADAATDWLYAQFQARVGNAFKDSYPFVYWDVISKEAYVDSPGDLAYDVMQYSGSTPVAGYLLVWCGLGSETEIAQATATLPAGVPWIALIKRGQYYFGEKVLWAQNAGASGVILFNNDATNPDAMLYGTLVWDPSVDPLQFKIGAVSTSLNEGLEILQAMGLTGASTPCPAPNGKTAHMGVSTVCEWKTGHNVWAKITGEKYPHKYVIIGAHYDHLGTNPLLPDDKVYNGANDNASGTVALLHIAEAMANYPNKPDKSVIFAAFSGEEDGLYGSADFVARYPGIVKNTALMINLDEIGAGELSADGVPRSNLYIEEMPKQSGSQWAPRLVYTTTQALVEHGLVTLGITGYGPGGLSLGLEDFGYVEYIGRSDHEPFINAGVDAVAVFTLADISPFYHDPRDEVSLIDPAKLQAATRVAAAAAYRVAEHSTQPALPTDDVHKTFPAKHRDYLVDTVEQ